jgi:hypothetical protein
MNDLNVLKGASKALSLMSADSHTLLRSPESGNLANCSNSKVNMTICCGCCSCCWWRQLLLLLVVVVATAAAAGP